MTSHAIELRGLHQRKPDGSVEIFGPRSSKTAKLRLNLDPETTTPLELLRQVFCSDSLSVEMRVAAALGAMPYCHPRIVLIPPMGAPQKITIVGGLPPLPGTDSRFPGPRPAAGAPAGGVVCEAGPASTADDLDAALIL
jgi:hypothetical protein